MAALAQRGAVAIGIDAPYFRRAGSGCSPVSIQRCTVARCTPSWRAAALTGRS